MDSASRLQAVRSTFWNRRLWRAHVLPHDILCESRAGFAVGSTVEDPCLRSYLAYLRLVGWVDDVATL